MNSQTKRIAVIDMIKKVNELNRTSTCSPEMRNGWNTFLEDMLEATGNYAGFSFWTNDDVPSDITPGMRKNASDAERFEGCDDTRRVYQIAHGIRT